MAPNCIIGLTVVGKDAATVMTSSPFFMALSFNLGEVKVENAIKLADEPEFTVIKHFKNPKNANYTQPLVKLYFENKCLANPPHRLLNLKSVFQSISSRLCLQIVSMSVYVS